MSGMFYQLNYKLYDKKKIMRNIGLGQILVLLLLCFLLFGDFSSLKKSFINISKSVNDFLFKNNRRKGN